VHENDIKGNAFGVLVWNELQLNKQLIMGASYYLGTHRVHNHRYHFRRLTLQPKSGCCNSAAIKSFLFLPGSRPWKQSRQSLLMLSRVSLPPVIRKESKTHRSGSVPEISEVQVTRQRQTVWCMYDEWCCRDLEDSKSALVGDPYMHVYSAVGLFFNFTDRKLLGFLGNRHPHGTLSPRIQRPGPSGQRRDSRVFC
jgi:hypothetical protein